MGKAKKEWRCENYQKIRSQRGRTWKVNKYGNSRKTEFCKKIIVVTNKLAEENRHKTKNLEERESVKYFMYIYAHRTREIKCQVKRK